MGNYEPEFVGNTYQQGNQSSENANASRGNAGVEVCPQCGASVPAGEVFCRYCGRQMHSGNAYPGNQYQTGNGNPTGNNFGYPMPQQSNLQPNAASSHSMGTYLLWLLCALAPNFLPVVGIILPIVFAFSGSDQERKNFFRATLIVYAVLFVIGFLFGILFFTVFAGSLFAMFPMLEDILDVPAYAMF